jgi:hypothetical protein
LASRFCLPKDHGWKRDAQTILLSDDALNAFMLADSQNKTWYASTALAAFVALDMGYI